MAKVYFITGGNRGIGLAIASNLASDPENIVIASAREPSKATELNKLAENGNVHVVKLDVSSQKSIDELDIQLRNVAADGIDYFINNAGIAKAEHLQFSMNVNRDLWVDHFTTNSLAPVMITQVIYPYLLKKTTRVVYFVSSLVGLVANFYEHHSSAYGMSKAALNHYTRLLDWELRDKDFIVVSIHPGLVASDMVSILYETMPKEKADALMEWSVTPEASADLQVKLLHQLTKEDSGKFFDVTAKEFKTTVDW